MCGIVYLQGISAQEQVEFCLKRIAHRGPDDENIVRGDDFALAFCRLSINDNSENGRQPFSCGTSISAINGEIYNYRELAQKYSIALNGFCDTQIILPLYEIVGDDIVDDLDGFYSAVIVKDDSIICLRDEMGQKPLFYGKTNSCFFISSELKAVQEVCWFKEVPLGITKISKKDFSLMEYKRIKPRNPSKTVLEAMTDAVKKRIPFDGSDFGVFLSGGLDSSIVAALTLMFAKNVHFFSLVDEKSPDFIAVRQVVDFLKIENIHFVELPKQDELEYLIKKVVFHTESFNPSIISNGLATYLLSKKARECGLKTIMSGEGSDELFCGYRNFAKDEDWESFRKMLINDMHYTELRRLDLCCMANSIEPRCPFLDREVLAISNALGYDSLFKNGCGKSILRESFKNLLPESVFNRKKVSCDVGSGIRGLVVNYLKSNGRSERENLREVWSEFKFGAGDQAYYSRYPAFDALIDKRGASHC